MFARRLAELKARELELRLRSLGLRDEMRSYKARVTEPLRWGAGLAKLAGGGVGLAGLLLGLRHGGSSRRILVWLSLGLKALKLWRGFSAGASTTSASPSAASSTSPAADPPPKASPNP